MAVILFSDHLHTADAEPMIFRVWLGGLRKAVHHSRHRLNKVFLMNQHKLLLLGNGQADHAMLTVKVPGFFDGVV